MELITWPGDPKLSESFDPNSLAVITYIKFGNVPVQVQPSNNPGAFSYGELPRLQHGDNHISGVEHIFTYLRKENYGLEYEFADRDLIMMEALLHNIHSYLIPALEHLWWLDGHGYTNVARPLYGKAVGFPKSLYWLSFTSRALRQRLLCDPNKWSFTLGKSFTEDDAVRQIFLEAKRQLTALSYFLGDKTYFFGDKPSAVDALLFGWLWPLLRLFPSSHELVRHVLHCENLYKFLQRIKVKYFRGAACITYPGGDEATDAYEPSEDVATSTQHPYRNTFLFFGVSVLACVSFAWFHGIFDLYLQVQSSHEEPAAESE